MCTSPARLGWTPRTTSANSSRVLNPILPAPGAGGELALAPEEFALEPIPVPGRLGRVEEHEGGEPRIGSTTRRPVDPSTRRSTLLWEYRCDRCRVRCRCGNRHIVVEVTRFGAGNRERTSGRRRRPRGTGGKAQRGCGAPSGTIMTASVIGRPGFALAAHGAAVRGGSRCCRCCARRDGCGAQDAYWIRSGDRELRAKRCRTQPRRSCARHSRAVNVRYE